MKLDYAPVTTSLMLLPAGAREGIIYRIVRGHFPLILVRGLILHLRVNTPLCVYTNRIVPFDFCAHSTADGDLQGVALHSYSI